jgi:hypothetical protein
MALELSHPTPPEVDAEFVARVADARDVPHAVFFAAAPDAGDSLVVQSFPWMRSLDWGPLRRELRRRSSCTLLCMVWSTRRSSPSRSYVANEA